MIPHEMIPVVLFVGLTLIVGGVLLALLAHIATLEE